MATIICSDQHVAITSGSKVKVISYSDPSEEVVFDLKAEAKESEEKGNEKQKEQKKSEVKTVGGVIDPHIPTGRVLTAAFSGSGMYFAACTDEKELTLWTTTPGWNRVWTRMVVKRCMAVTFDNSETALYVADKAGDVYRFEIGDENKESVLILGHVSMLLDVVISHDDKYILTAERDEKIRVSHLPNAYNIHTFCLGHTEFLSRLYILSSDQLISCAGDSTMMLWDYKNGKELCRTSFDWAKPSSEDHGAKNKVTVTCISCFKKHNLVAVTLLDHSTVPVYHVTAEKDGHWTFQEVTRLQCKHPPWSLAFDPNGRLLVLVPNPEEPLLVCVIEPNNDGVLQVSENVSKEDSAALLAQKAKNDWEFLKCSCNVQSVLRGLHKVPYDNMPDYRQRKQQRIEYNQSKKGNRRRARKLNKKRPIEGAADNGDAPKRTMLDEGGDGDQGEDENGDEGNTNSVEMEAVESTS
ncbi:tRNA (guanine-N(7)-)-methyltransferase non-catalytic subunit wdr4-like [Lytechinus variegatus]|uniref:tRNA (guanine-N(7)-)-methyltransferase non-catalytic subunit wdr4-like n=1 Tax=Lytechinus variegatus TaxID=7654 RepID=UPI001BB231BC|nr:tRNA (guanine-N(7)-)-methyltransferase non-catalytic subunit wdr4-like [Lytechinus variegatus]